MYIKLIIAVLWVTVLSSCSPGVQSSLPTEDLSAPSQPVLIPSPAGVLVQPTAAATKRIGTPVPGWEDIPIMPGAYDAELEDIVYFYSVDTPIGEVEEYYLVKMDVNGWTLTNRQVIETGSSSGPSTALDFQRDDRLLNVMLVNLAGGNATSVILSKLGP